MTAHDQQPQREYIISEKLTSEIEGYLKEKFPECISIRISRVIHSHPHTPSTETPITFEMMEEYGKRTARATTLATLDAIVLFISENYPKAKIEGDYLYPERTGLREAYNKVLKKCESLRTQSTTAQQESNNSKGGI